MDEKIIETFLSTLLLMIEIFLKSIKLFFMKKHHFVADSPNESPLKVKLFEILLFKKTPLTPRPANFGFSV